MLFPVLMLVLGRAVLDQLTFATNLSAHHRARRIHAPFPARARARARRRRFAALPDAKPGPAGRIVRKRNVAVDPIAHLARADASKGSVPTTAFQREHRSTVEAVAREPDHLAVLCAARVRTTRREIKEDVGGGHEERVRKEDLRVGRRLVREEHYEWWTSLVQDRAEDEVDLREAGRASLELERVLEPRIYICSSVAPPHREVSREQGLSDSRR
jgi:hypothetical protein